MLLLHRFIRVRLAASFRGITAFLLFIVLIAACGESDDTATVPLDPSIDGPYAVGSTTEMFVRASSTTGQPRELNTVIWYPAPLSTTGEAANEGGVHDAPLAPGGPFPLLLFSHGSCGLPIQSKFLTTRLASYGFIVAAPPHPGNTIFDGATLDRCINPVNLIDAFINRPPDIEFVIDQMLALSAGEDRFAGSIDAARIGVFGHSFGGQTALVVGARDARVGAVLALAPGGSGAAVLALIENIAVPGMVQGGEIDSVAPFATQQQPVYERLGPPRFLVEILKTGHFAFADRCLSPTGTTYPDCRPDTLSQPDAHALVLRYALPFLGRYVAGEMGWATLLAPTSDTNGVVYTAEF